LEEKRVWEECGTGSSAPSVLKGREKRPEKKGKKIRNAQRGDLGKKNSGGRVEEKVFAKVRSRRMIVKNMNRSQGVKMEKKNSLKGDCQNSDHR